MVIGNSAPVTFNQFLVGALIEVCGCAGAGGAPRVEAAPPSAASPDVDFSMEQESMMGMKVCTGRELAKTRTDLKAQRQRMLKAASPDTRKSMSQWFKAGDADAGALCEVEGQRNAGASMQGLAYVVCLNGEDGRKLKELKELEKRPEGS